MKNTQPRVNKSEWIRSQSSTLAAKEIVDLAKKQGIKLSLAQVYTARSAAKKMEGAGKRGPGRPAGSGKSSNGHAADDSIKEQFVKLAVRIGTDEAGRLLQRIVEQQQL